MWRAPLLSLVLGLAAPLLHAACPCLIHFGVCDEARQSNAVFIGTVESVSPPALDPWARARSTVSLPATEAMRLQGDASPEALAKLKKMYLDMFTGIPDRPRQRIAEAQTQGDLQKAFEEVQSEGRLAKFTVKTLFRRADDDGDDGLGDDDTPPKTLDIWTSAGDCGVDFQPGETYLVYAIEDEDSGKLETSICMRTRRLSDDKGDLGFLYFLRNAGNASTRLEGYVSTSFADQNLPRYENAVAAPSPGNMIELDSGGLFRYTQSDNEGFFAFDGLKEGDYKLSLLGPGFPRAPRTVISTRQVRAKPNSCARQIFVLPANQR